MSASNAQWYFSQQAGQWYTYSESEQCIVYQDGRRMSYPSDQWRALQMAAAQSASVPRTEPQPSPTTVDELARLRAQSSSSSGSQEYSITGAHLPSSSGHRQLEPTYRKHPASWFQRYRVFKTLWHESAGDDNATFNTRVGYTRENQYGQWIYSKFRWFVVVAATTNYSRCLSIMTYNQQGTAKRGVNPAEHAIAYTGSETQPTQAERRQEPMRTSIEVQRDDPRTMLDPLSRLNYGRIYTVEHNVKVKAFGWIHPRSRHFFDMDRTTVSQSIEAVPRTNVSGNDEDAIDEGDEESSN